MTPNPHDLINLPGYGNAQKELRKAGLWREDAEGELERARTALLTARDSVERAMEALEE